MLQSWNLATSVTATSGRPLTARVLGNVSDASGTGSTGSSRADSTGVPLDSGSGLFNLRRSRPSFGIASAMQAATRFKARARSRSTRRWGALYSVRPKAAGVSGQLPTTFSIM